VLEVPGDAFWWRRPAVINGGDGGENNSNFRVAPNEIVPHGGASKARHYISARGDVKVFAARLIRHCHTVNHALPLKPLQ